MQIIIKLEGDSITISVTSSDFTASANLKADVIPNTINQLLHDVADHLDPLSVLCQDI